MDTLQELQSLVEQLSSHPQEIDLSALASLITRAHAALSEGLQRSCDAPTVAEMTARIEDLRSKQTELQARLDAELQRNTALNADNLIAKQLLTYTRDKLRGKIMLLKDTAFMTKHAADIDNTASLGRMLELKDRIDREFEDRFLTADQQINAAILQDITPFRI